MARKWHLLGALAVLLPACSPAALPEPLGEEAAFRPRADAEIRDFLISVDGRPAGRSRITISSGPGGRLIMSARAAVRVRYLIFSYRYTYQGTETYQGGRLLRLESRADDDGKRFTLTATAAGARLRVTVNGQERDTTSAVWTTSYWQLPPGAARTRPVTLLDADTGKEMKGSLAYLGDVRLPVAGQARACAHYRVTGPPSAVDLWYDGGRRLVRQEYLEDGHRTVLELESLRRTAR